MILTDRRGHLVSDESLAELHTFAARLGLKRHYFQGTRRGHPHYDLTTGKARARALREGATRVKAGVLVQRMVRTVDRRRDCPHRRVLRAEGGRANRCEQCGETRPYRLTSPSPIQRVLVRQQGGNLVR